MFKKKVIPLILVLTLCMSCVLPVNAASISGDVEPSGVEYLENVGVVSLPDRDRYTFNFSQPEGNFYWGSKSVSGSDTVTSYDLNTSVLANGGGTSSSSPATDYLEVYPAGRSYFLFPFTDMYGNPVSISDCIFTVSLQSRKVNYVYSKSNGGSSSFSIGAYSSPLFCFLFYDENYELISSSQVSNSSASFDGTASESTFSIATYSYKVDIPYGTAYIVPRLLYADKFKTVSYSSTSYQYNYTQVSSANMSCSFSFDVLRDMETVDGVWYFDDSPSRGFFDFSQDIDFTSGGVQYTGISAQHGGSMFAITYSYGAGGETVYADQWFGTAKRMIDFGTEPQPISSEFSYWLRYSATRIGDSPGAGMGNISIKDYSGAMEIFTIDSVKFPCTVAVQNNGLAFTYAGDDEVSYFYEYSGSGNFVGCSLVPNDSMTRYTEGRTFTMTSSGSIYLHIEGDVGPDQPVDPDPSEPTEPSDPTEPVDPSDPTGPNDGSGTGSDDPSSDPGSIGEDLLNDLLNAIPDYSEGYVLALIDFSKAFSYEGTDCYLTLPALTMPEISGLIPEFEIMPEMQLDAVGMLGLFPPWIVSLVQSLLTVALIAYCFKELYDTISFFMTLKKGES